MTSGRPLTQEQRQEIEARMSKGDWPKVIARDMGISRCTVVEAVKNKKI